MGQDSSTNLEDLLSHAGWLHALARSIVGDDGLAEDVVQETLHVAIQSPPRDRGAIRTWLWRVARNFALRTRRDRETRRQREHAASRPEMFDAAAPELSERADMLGHVLSAVLSLPSPYRSVILLRYFEGLEPTKIARRQNISPATIRSRLRRALDLLRRKLSCQGPEGERTWSPALLSLLHWSPKTITGAVAGPAAPVAALAGLGGVAIMTKSIALVVSLAVAGALAAFILPSPWDRHATGISPTTPLTATSSTHGTLSPAAKSTSNTQIAPTAPLRLRLQELENARTVASPAPSPKAPAKPEFKSQVLPANPVKEAIKTAMDSITYPFVSFDHLPPDIQKAFEEYKDCAFFLRYPKNRWGMDGYSCPHYSIMDEHRRPQLQPINRENENLLMRLAECGYDIAAERERRIEELLAEGNARRFPSLKKAFDYIRSLGISNGSPIMRTDPITHVVWVFLYGDIMNTPAMQNLDAEVTTIANALLKGRGGNCLGGWHVHVVQ